MKNILAFIYMLCLSTLTLAGPTQKRNYQQINFSKVDEYALKSPIARDEDDMDKLVTYLIKPFRQDIDKARAIFAWIVYNIDYDNYEERFVDRTIKKGDKFEYQGHILKTRSGVCRDIAALYHKMAQKAGLKTRIVSGIAGSNLTKKNAENNQHAWLVIDINGEWEYLDPTWAIQGEKSFTSTGSDREYRRDMRQRLKDKDRLQPRKERRVGNTWFLADKDEMIKTHYPDDEEWQLQKKKVSYNQFLARSHQ